MIPKNWILLAFVGAALIYETSGLNCVVCSAGEPGCADGTKVAEACPADVTSCFVRITNDNVARGCSTAADETYCIEEDGKDCKKCKTAGCNNFKWLQCHKCLTTDTDKACANAQAGTGTFCTNFKTNGKCYQRFLANKQVERDCESDLSPVTEDVCAGTQQCKSCSSGDGCNNEVSTTFEETKCVQCKSDDAADGSDCLKGTKTEAVCANPDGKCFSRIIDGGILQRGCHSALSAQEQTDCTGDLCQVCTEAGCNKGVFPENRLQCYKCQNANGNDVSCAEELAGDGKSEICNIYKSDDKCFTRVTAALNFERGCQSDLGENAKVCDGLSDCLECDSKNCNGLSEQKLKASAKCLQCDSSTNGCEDVASSSVLTCSLGENDACFVRVNNGNLERNCLLSLSATDQAKCNNEQDQSCVKCSGQGCNVQKWIKCHQCKESSSGTCNGAQQDANAQFCPKYTADNQCYERLESEKVVRGCTNDLSEAACTDNLECKTCEDSACNKEAASTLKTDQRCLQCSTTSDAGGDCLKGTAASQPCKKESSKKCFSQVLTDGHLKRGCQGDLTAAEITACTGDTCKICDDTDCNKGLYPENRLKCYQCKSSVDESCTNELQGADKSGYCKLFVAQDKCYSRDANEIFERGCQSDLGLTADACKDLDEKHCKSCNETDCNAISKLKLNGAGSIALNVAVVAVAAIAAIAGL